MIVEKIIKDILKQRFKDVTSKHDIKYSSNGIMYVACPVCGDSKKKLNKKRCAIYTDTFSYHCFNCGRGGTLLNLFTRFGYDYSKIPELENIKKQSERREEKNILNIFKNSDNNIIKEIESISIPYEDIIKVYELVDPTGGGKLELLKRRITFNEKLKTNKRGDRIFILNVINIDDKKLVTYINVKNLHGSIRYYNINLKKMYEDIGRDFNPVNQIYEKYQRSLNIFNYLNIKIDEMFFVFEGELDCILFEQISGTQSIALSGATKSISDSLETAVYFFDYDKTGISKSFYNLKNHKNVFLFSRFCKEIFNVDTKQFKKFDFTDFISFLINKKNIDFEEITEKIKNNFKKYISNNKYDLIFI